MKKANMRVGLGLILLITLVAVACAHRSSSPETKKASLSEKVPTYAELRLDDEDDGIWFQDLTRAQKTRAPAGVFPPELISSIAGQWEGPCKATKYGSRKSTLEFSHDDQLKNEKRKMVISRYIGKACEQETLQEVVHSEIMGFRSFPSQLSARAWRIGTENYSKLTYETYSVLENATVRSDKETVIPCPSPAFKKCFQVVSYPERVFTVLVENDSLYVQEVDKQRRCPGLKAEDRPYVIDRIRFCLKFSRSKLAP